MLVSGSEMVLAVALVVVLALAFMGILMLSFPRGVGLSDFYTDFVGEQGVGRGRQWQRDGGGNAPFVAVLTEVQRKVRDRPASAIAWNEAYAGMRLEEQHTVQTLAHSGAAIRVGETGYLRLGERSLVVIKRDDEQRGLRRRRTSVVLLGGRVDGNIAARGGKSSRLNIVTVGGTAALRRSERGDHLRRVGTARPRRADSYGARAVVSARWPAAGLRGRGAARPLPLGRAG
jgi:hypothetical protein